MFLRLRKFQNVACMQIVAFANQAQAEKTNYFGGVWLEDGEGLPRQFTMEDVLCGRARRSPTENKVDLQGLAPTLRSFLPSECPPSLVTLANICACPAMRCLKRCLTVFGLLGKLYKTHKK